MWTMSTKALLAAPKALLSVPRIGWIAGLLNTNFLLSSYISFETGSKNPTSFINLSLFKLQVKEFQLNLVGNQSDIGNHTSSLA
jgi:hypothetical protein